ncbi:MAG: lysine N(6)-hydroxylase/L-ornithine N(5)-oxygenase family protein [Lautropia sp.]|nr:lysine N(6)-hydroxylase/L-ornithine N(5)-oxygenase family protein [Lautropia sp.]
MNTVHDLIGIGFGPSNLALAIALHEQPRPHAIDAHFIEKQPHFAWHPDMLLPGTHMQISFLKDLVSMRNPRSHFSFVNYLHHHSRLQDFINLKTFLPSRIEFNDYFRWSATHFRDQCSYGEEVVDIQPVFDDDEVHLLRVISQTRTGQRHQRLARNLALGLGGRPHVPDAFLALQQDPRIFHSHHYLKGLSANPTARRIAILGAGQSAAEIFVDLGQRPGIDQIDLIMRAHVIKPADDSPFVNEIFNTEFVDYIFNCPAADRHNMLCEFRHTNYACTDLDLICQIFDTLYQQRVTAQQRQRILCRHLIEDIQNDGDGITLQLHDQNHGQHIQRQYDALILATGYERGHHQALLAKLAPYLGNFEVARDYRIRSSPTFKPAIFVQGGSEQTHGLSDTLLSVTAVRVGEIAESLLTVLQKQPQHTETT